MVGVGMFILCIILLWHCRTTVIAIWDKYQLHALAATDTGRFSIWTELSVGFYCCMCCGLLPITVVDNVCCNDFADMDVQNCDIKKVSLRNDCELYINFQHEDE